MNLLQSIDWEKINNLIPVIIQDYRSKEILMLGYMNQEALEQTLDSKVVTFFSRTKNRLWVKGETSGNFLHVQSLSLDCDQDSLLIVVKPVGATCHLGNVSCFNDKNDLNYFDIGSLEKIIIDRIKNASHESYTKQLCNAGIAKIAQKVGEEAVEVVIAALNNDNDELRYETADLIYHLLVLLQVNKLSWQQVLEELENRHKEKPQ